MSKKIMKRSLALGALMAFVITGSAWAEQVLVSNKTVNGISNQAGISTGDRSEVNWKLGGYNLLIDGYVRDNYAVYANDYSFNGDKGSNLEIKDTFYGINGNGTISVDKLNINVFSHGINAAAGDTVITVNDIDVVTEGNYSLYTQKNGNLTVNATNDVDLEGCIWGDFGKVSVSGQNITNKIVAPFSSYNPNGYNIYNDGSQITLDAIANVTLKGAIYSGNNSSTIITGDNVDLESNLSVTSSKLKIDGTTKVDIVGDLTVWNSGETIITGNSIDMESNLSVYDGLLEIDGESNVALTGYVYVTGGEINVWGKNISNEVDDFFSIYNYGGQINYEADENIVFKGDIHSDNNGRTNIRGYNINLSESVFGNSLLVYGGNVEVNAVSNVYLNGVIDNRVGDINVYGNNIKINPNNDGYVIKNGNGEILIEGQSSVDLNGTIYTYGTDGEINISGQNINNRSTNSCSIYNDGGTINVEAIKDITFKGDVYNHNSGDTTISADNISLDTNWGYSLLVYSGEVEINATNNINLNGTVFNKTAGVLNLNGNLDIVAEHAIETYGNAETYININGDKTTTINGDIVFVKQLDLAEGNNEGQIRTNAKVDLKLSDYHSYLSGNIFVFNDNNVINNKATYKDVTGMNLGISNGAYWATQATGGAVDNFVSNLTMANGIVKHNNVGNITVANYSGDGTVEFNSNGHLHIDSGSGSLNLTTADLTVDKFDDTASKLGVKEAAKGIKAKLVIAESDIVGETIATVGYADDEENGYYHGVITDVTEKVNTKNEALSNAGVGMKLHNRAHMNDMNKRLGELRDANGDLGVWTRMVRGESEYENVKAQYNQYQLGYDEKLSVDKRWTVGAAVTFSEGDASYGYGSTEDKSTAFAIYGSKLNNDGTFVDLIARYAHLESDVEDQAGKGDYSTNGMSVSAEFGKRIQQGNGLWIEPQFELTYGNIDSAEFQIGGKTVQVGDMDSLIGRVGFSLGKDIKQGNVYARASYLYDFDGETETAFTNGVATRSFNEDLGGGWWEVGVGANINLSKATYVYADVEKTFGGEVDTNWQWNLGVRYSF